MSQLGSLHTRGRLGGVLPLAATRWFEVERAWPLPLTGGDLGIAMGCGREAEGGGRGSMSLMIGLGTSGVVRCE